MSRSHSVIDVFERVEAYMASVDRNRVVMHLLDQHHLPFEGRDKRSENCFVSRGGLSINCLRTDDGTDWKVFDSCVRTGLPCCFHSRQSFP